MNNLQTTQPVSRVPKQQDMAAYDRLPAEARYKLAYAPTSINAFQTLELIDEYSLVPVLHGIDIAIQRFHGETEVYYP
tara:strand:- start:1898 stop:2131 length:234 start_codon:yes stop_codon:yes gene_type:complete